MNVSRSLECRRLSSTFSHLRPSAGHRQVATLVVVVVVVVVVVAVASGRVPRETAACARKLIPAGRLPPQLLMEIENMRALALTQCTARFECERRKLAVAATVAARLRTRRPPPSPPLPPPPPPSPSPPPSPPPSQLAAAFAAVGARARPRAGHSQVSRGRRMLVMARSQLVARTRQFFRRPPLPEAARKRQFVFVRASRRSSLRTSSRLTIFEPIDCSLFF